MELQLALDFESIPEAKEIVREVGDNIDILEIGTPFIVKEGLHAVQEIRKEFSNIKILADLKVADAGGYEAECAFKAGADIVTVLGVADDITISSSVEAAQKYHKSIMIDMISINDLAKRAKEIDALGVDYICVHTAVDVQKTGKNPLEDLRAVSRVIKNAKAAVAGGVKLSSIADIVKENPAIVVVGGGITGQADKRLAAMELKKAMLK